MSDKRGIARFDGDKWIFWPDEGGEIHLNTQQVDELTFSLKATVGIVFINYNHKRFRHFGPGGEPPPAHDPNLYLLQDASVSGFAGAGAYTAVATPGAGAEALVNAYVKEIVQSGSELVAFLTTDKHLRGIKSGEEKREAEAKYKRRIAESCVSARPGAHERWEFADLLRASAHGAGDALG